METSQNLAAQIVNSACQEFQQLVDNQAMLTPMELKATRLAKVCMAIAMIGIALTGITCPLYLLMGRETIKVINDKFGFNAFIVMLCASFLALIFFFIYAHFDAKRRTYLQAIKIIADGRLEYIKSVISRAFMEHICANDDDYSTDFYFNRMKEISSGFFADDFDSELSSEETEQIRSWLKASYAACLQTA